MDIPDDEKRQIVRELRGAKNMLVGEVNSIYRQYVRGG
jgi:hypothetical protein